MACYKNSKADESKGIRGRMRDVPAGAVKKLWGSDVVGLIPAAGKAERISPLPCSKELWPIGFQKLNGQSPLRPKVACHYLLEKFQRASISHAYIILRKGKWDIPGYFGDGHLVNMHVGYLIMGAPFGPPFTRIP